MSLLKIGDYNTLTITRQSPHGIYLDSSAGEILLPNKYVQPEFAIGSPLQVFVYTDSEDRLVATTLHPKVVVDHFASLLVKQITRYGAFLDWGLEKDLLLPFKEQPFPVKEGHHVVIRACLDHRTQRVIAVAKIESFLSSDISALTPGQAVHLLLYDRTPLGFKAVVNETFGGMLYHNEIFKPVEVGMALEGFIKKIRSDGKLDISLQPQGFSQVKDAKHRILSELQQAGGFLPLHDNSTPEAIQQAFHMSKKTFKKAIGNLFKEGKIKLLPEGISLS